MTDISALSPRPCILRILNGPLQGCEFPLAELRTLFIVAPLELLDAHVVSVPEDAIFVPLEQGGCNFEVLPGDSDLEGVTLHLLDEPTQTRHCPFLQPVQIGGLSVVVREAGQAWVHALPGSQTLQPPQSAAGQWPLPVAAKWAGGGLLLALLVASTGLWPLPDPAPQTHVRSLIGGASGDIEVVLGRDRKVYVFVASERDAGWSRQVLMRNATVANVLVIDQERRRLENLLIEHDPQLAWHALDLKDPTQPRLLLSAQRNVLTPQRQARLLDMLLEAAPYARDVVVQLQDENLLADLAEQGLRRLALAFDRVGYAGSVTFALGADMRDAELATARQYVGEFRRQWGDRYVHFAVELKDDLLKGKSFQNGPQGYIKTTSSSWHFPKQIWR